jgi:hypothetical protein
MSQVVVESDPANDPRFMEKLDYAKKVIGNLACHMYWWMIKQAYHESTITRVMHSFYLEHARLAPESTWDPITQTATSKFQSKTDTWLEDNSKYDRTNWKGSDASASKPSTVVEMANSVRKSLLQGLNYKPDERCSEVGSKISGPSALTGDGTSIGGASSVNTNNTAGLLQKKDYALRLAEAATKEADLRAQHARDIAEKDREHQEKLQALERKMESMLQLMAKQQGHQGAPPPDPSGSGAPPTNANGSSGAPQGS